MNDLPTIPTPRARRVALLPEHVANQIAAGEVVERPASVVKELVENSLDAGAKNIEVSVVAGGRQLIQVRDDGCGMIPDDALLAIQRHATSKIRDIHDVEKVATLGFRGEALPSIASVSRFSLLTRPTDGLEGFDIQINGGTILDARAEGCPSGTTITVRNLFFNVPARRKFLKTEQTELANIRQILHVYALAHPEVGFRLSIDEREALRLPPGGTIEDRLRELFGDDFLDGLVPVDFTLDVMRIHGKVSLPHRARKDRKDQFFFVNGRPASAALIHYAVQQAFREKLPADRHPALLLFIDLPPDWVDVNVHPTKREVRFRHPGPVRDAVMSALLDAVEPRLPGAPAAASFPPAEGAPASTPFPVAAATRPSAPSSFGTPWRATLASQRTFDYPLTPPSSIPQAAPPPPGSPAPEIVTLPPLENSPEPQTPWAGHRILGWTGNQFAVLEVPEGLVLVDPQSAHERVIFERLTGRLSGGEALSQGLLRGETVRLHPQEALRLRAHLGDLSALGMEVSDFGGDTFLVDAMPAAIASCDPALVLRELAGRLEEQGRAGVRAWSRDQIARAAAEAAVPAGRRLSDPELAGLLRDLARCEMPYTSPSGRPTVVFMGNAEIRSKFAR